ncbi:MAG: hypothetical protein EA378_07865 [Phycisphaerales bacterium]|nr:MAG: hypothetical protein EA378_07865 [Phycisphaerales bacterium]
MRIGLFGATLDTGNLGVSALSHATLTGLRASAPDAALCLFDNRDGVGAIELRDGDDRFEVERCGARLSRRYWEPESLGRVRLGAALGGAGSASARAFLACDAILQMSGGDSFTDLYGPWRFRAITLPMRMAIAANKPLVLLPQTYGPFRGEKERAIAAELVRGAAMCSARDERSFEVLKGLLGDRFDPSRHRRGVDVAFRLGMRKPDQIDAALGSWLADDVPERDRPIGFNVSGLIYNDPEKAASHYGFRASYRDCVIGFLRRVLAEAGSRVILVPHVLTPPGHYESDEDACRAVLGELGEVASGRVAIVPSVYDQNEIKWIISRCAWFCGTRMHATIAALSTGVPTGTISYSPKAQGVFDLCAQGEHVIDPTRLDTESVIRGVWRSFESREAARTSLGEALAGVREAAGEQMRAITGAIEQACGATA